MILTNFNKILPVKNRNINFDRDKNLIFLYAFSKLNFLLKFWICSPLVCAKSQLLLEHQCCLMFATWYIWNQKTDCTQRTVIEMIQKGFGNEITFKTTKARCSFVPRLSKKPKDKLWKFIVDAQSACKKLMFARSRNLIFFRSSWIPISNAGNLFEEHSSLTDPQKSLQPQPIFLRETFHH